jgi:NADPH:quinone reductase-like Zn-dependent oxidoreductase
MKAIVLNEYGDSSHLKLAEIPEPKPGPGEIKVKVAAASLSKVRNGGVIASTVGPPPGDQERGVVGKGMQAHVDSKRLAGLAEAVMAGKLKLPIAKRVPLAEAASAQRLAEAGGISKVLLRV